MKIDFIVYHELQAQACSSVFDKLQIEHDCRWLTGPFNNESPGNVGVLIDHRCFHHIFKSKSGYQYLFHLSHDIADVDIYKNERLHDFDIIFVPTRKHYNACLAAGYDVARVKIAGWPKYDHIEISQTFNDVFSRIKTDKQLTILYAPTFASNYEWKKLFPFFQRIGYPVIIKNHIYVNEGQALPRGQEVEYRAALTSVLEMEAKAHELGFSVAPRSENICKLFGLADILISDSSSCLIEFLPFGVPIETGGGPSIEYPDFKPEACLLSRDVLLFPVDKLAQLDSISFLNLLKVFTSRQEIIIEYKRGSSVGSTISDEITSYLKAFPPRYGSRYRDFFLRLKSIKHRLTRI